MACAATERVRAALCERHPQAPLSSSALSADALPARATLLPEASRIRSSETATEARTQEVPTQLVGKFVVNSFRA